MINVTELDYCYGCGICSLACGRKIIQIKLNDEGFYAPGITDSKQCTACGMCLDVCSFVNKPAFYLQDNADANPRTADANSKITKPGGNINQQEPKGYAAWSNDKSIRRSCSSGGIGFETVRSLMRRGYGAIVARYNAESGCAEHYLANNEAELVASQGSKYIPSLFQASALPKIERNKRYAVVGTPCMIASFLRLITVRKWRRENFVLIDFFCHGVPSMLLWQKYLTEAEQSIGAVAQASWRNKQDGWHDSWAMLLQGKDGRTWGERLTKGDPFYAMFLSDCCLGRQCYGACLYKLTNSLADIRIGDFWGKTYSSDEQGTSAVLALTQRGEEALKETANVTLISHSTSQVTEGQQGQMPQLPPYRAKLLRLLKSESTPLSDIVAKAEKWKVQEHYISNLTHPKQWLSIIKRKIKRR